MMREEIHLPVYTKFLLLYILVIYTFSTTLADIEYKIDFINVYGPSSDKSVLDANITLICKASPNNSLLWWSFEGRNLTTEKRTALSKQTVNGGTVFLAVGLHDLQISDAGNYTCHAVLPENNEIQSAKTFFLNPTLAAEVIEKRDARAKVGTSAVLECVIRGYPLSQIGWTIERSGLSELLESNIRTNYLNESYVTTKLNFTSVDHYDNGTYACGGNGPAGYFQSSVHLFVLHKPVVNIEFVKAVGSHILFVNWTVNDGNERVQRYFLQTKRNETNQWVYYPEQIGGGNTSYLIKNLENNTAYQVSLLAMNAIGRGEAFVYPLTITTLSDDPTFVPVVEVKGTTSKSVSLGWTPPPAEVRDYIQYYQIILQNNETKQETIHPSSSLNAYLFTNLISATTYLIKIAACSEYTKVCGAWSNEVSGTTLDGVPDPPENLTVQCRFDNISRASFVSITWQPPKKPYGQIIHYNVVLSGVAKYLNQAGLNETMTYGPKVKTSDSSVTQARFEVVPPNTNYTVAVSAVTRLRHVSKESKAQCPMPPTLPEKEKLLRMNWKKVELENGRWLFRLSLNRLSERNGIICCYLVYLVKLKPGQRANDLPQPEDLPVSTYHQVHRNVSGGAYIAEAFNGHSWPSELFLGDGKSLRAVDSPCQSCLALQLHQKAEAAAAAAAATTVNIPLAQIPGLSVKFTTSSESSEGITEESTEGSTIPNPVSALPPQGGDSNFIQTDVVSERFRRKSRQVELTVLSETTMPPPASDPPEVESLAYDGLLDYDYNYTGFLEVLVHGENGHVISAYSSYFMSMNAGPTVLEANYESLELTIALHVLIGLVAVVFILLIVLFVLHNYTKTVAEEQGIEMTFTNTLMHLCRNVGGRHVPVSSSPPDIPPIPKAELAVAVAERHRDSDYGFQHEFELLPDRFPDRTTRASEARENYYKNRYPDIKAYDQTRVKLTPTEGVIGSDYINANYVVGYKERKKFICAQGPMDNTVNEFWRMVWEQHLEIILMLTNLEEYSKTKCAKYWPDSDAGDKKFGDFSVTHVQEKRFSDYIVRELKLRQVNGETANEKDKDDERAIIQYHYLVWKDFMAPENPTGILKFIKRINEDYSLEKGPILIHCSAGVGRTGTLVALDSLLQQLKEENQVAIFNTVCDLRHQRNFLVQSLKQYIFVYRALQEVSQSGDTEIKVAQLKSHVEKLRHKENGKDKSSLEEEFEKLQLLVDEKGKTWSVGLIEENKAKNGNQDVIPYDRNRVMLAPIPGKDHSTYINASFIEGYDNSESFIIAQDPLPNTLSDFWRMICEQCVSTLVMLSDLGDGARKCIRYWPEPDDESTYDNIKVRYIQSESCPYYTRREFAVTNMKTDDTIITTQFQYNGWPTVEGEVPEVTRGLIELVDQTQESHALAVADGSPGPTVVHCNWGAERSSIFLALSILVQQLKTEKSVDFFTVARKLRSQRQLMLQNFVQYEFLHRAIVNYADLHHMTENGTTSPL